MGGGPDPLRPLWGPGSTPIQGQGEQRQYGCKRYGLADFNASLLCAVLYLSANAYVTYPYDRYYRCSTPLRDTHTLNPNGTTN